MLLVNCRTFHGACDRIFDFFKNKISGRKLKKYEKKQIRFYHKETSFGKCRNLTTEKFIDF